MTFCNLKSINIDVDRTKVAELLISNGIDVNLKNKKGKTVLDVAKEEGNF